MCIETSLLLHAQLNQMGFYFFVFGSTMVQYNLHYLVKKNAVNNSQRLAWSLKSRTIHKALICFGVVLISIGLFSFRLHHLFILLVLGGVAVLYSFPFLPFSQKKRIKDFGLLKIITLALLWTLVTVWFPVADADNIDISFLLIFLRRFIFIFILCLLFDIRDTEIDRQENIETLSVKLGIQKSYSLCYILLIVFAVLSIIQFMHGPDVMQLSGMLISAVVTFCIIQLSRKNNSDIIYLALIDGMMLLQALLVVLAQYISVNLQHK